MKEQKTLPHGYFHEGIYKWTLDLKPGEWIPITPAKMSKGEFTNCIKYLISAGEPLTLSDDFSAFKRDDFTSLDFMR